MSIKAVWGTRVGQKVHRGKQDFLGRYEKINLLQGQ